MLPITFRNLLRITCCIGLLVGVVSPRRLQGVEFKAEVLDPGAGKVVYAVTVADVNNDGRQDVVAVTNNAVVWYQAPRWRKRFILSGATNPDNVCIVPHDIDRNGQVDFALGAGWPKNGGTIQWLAPGKRVEDQWDVFEIAAEPWTHRMRWADVLGKGEPQLVVSPLNATINPAGVRLLAFEVPANPRTQRWLPTVLNQDLNRLHNHWCVDREAIGMEASEEANNTVTLTASEEGISVIMPRSPRAESFRKIRLLPGAQGETAAQPGAGEVKTGVLDDGTRILATIEPMHGSQAVVYELNDYFATDPPKRSVLTDKLRGGHAVGCADLDRDGSDEIVVGWREANPGVGIVMFDRQPDGTWQETRIGSQVACEDLIVADVTGDDWPDIIAGGRATRNVVLYVNQGQ